MTEEVKNNMYISPVEQFRWPTVLTLLSMDCIHPYLSFMGFPEKLRDEFLQELRRRISQLPQDLATSDYGRSFRDSLLTWLEGKFGSHCFNALKSWVADIFYFDPHELAADGDWHHFLLRRPDFSRVLPLSLSESIDQLLEVFLTKINEVSSRMAIDEHAAYSKWDTEILRRRWEFDRFAQGEKWEGYNPWNDIANTSTHFQFVYFVASLKKYFSTDEIDQISKAAARLDALNAKISGRPTNILPLTTLKAFTYTHAFCKECAGEKIA